MIEPERRPRILRVGAPEARRTTDALERAGNIVIECGGPNGAPCPITIGEVCALVEDAAGIVFELDIDDPHHRSILRCYRDRPGTTTPIRLIAAADRREHHRHDLAGIPTVDHLGESVLFEFNAQVALFDMARRALRKLDGDG